MRDEASSSAYVPRLPTGVRLHHDQVRQRWVLLAPERIIELGAVELDILRACDGSATVRDIAEQLAARYAAPSAEVEADVREFIDALAARRIVDR